VKEDLKKQNANIEAAMGLIRDRQKWRHFMQPHQSNKEEETKTSAMPSTNTTL